MHRTVRNISYSIKEIDALQGGPFEFGVMCDGGKKISRYSVISLFGKRKKNEITGERENETMREQCDAAELIVVRLWV